MSNLVKKDYDAEEIFKQTFWANQKGLRSIQARKNREMAEAIMLFGQTYFREHFPNKHPELHTDMLALMCSDHKLKDLAVPRGHAKSTVIGFLLVLYRVCFQLRKFIVIVSDSEDKAKAFVMRIRAELEFNRGLIRDFAPDGKSLKSTDWAKTDFITSTGIRILAKGAGQSIRGELHLDSRPDMIVLDDIETDITAGNEELLNYILTNVVPSVNRRGIYDICYVGTIIKDMSVLHQMAINPEWCSAKWECLDDDGEMIAPDLLPKSEYEAQKSMYKSLGKMSLFYAENHNNPMVADQDATFRQEYFQHQREDELDLDSMNVYIAYDPAMPDRVGKKTKADRSAILVIATDWKENWYVLRVYANRDTPSRNRTLLFNLAKKYKPKKVWMETIAAQRAMYLEIRAEMKRKYIKFPFEEIPSHSGSKEARIEQLQPLYESGRIYHNPLDKNAVELERELLLFGRTPHDDMSDCLSFFLNRVKYPRKPIGEVKKKRYDKFDRLMKKPQGTANWKII